MMTLAAPDKKSVNSPVSAEEGGGRESEGWREGVRREEVAEARQKYIQTARIRVCWKAVYL